MGRDGEGEAHIHAAGIALDGRVEEFFGFGEGDDLVELAVDFRLVHAEDRAVEIDVFAAGEFGVKAGADFEKRGDAAFHAGEAFGGFGDAAENFEQGRFARAVSADDADDFAALDIKRDVAKGPEIALGWGFPAQIGESLERRFDRGDEGIAEGEVFLGAQTELVALSDVGDGNGRAHAMSAKRRSIFLK